MTSCKNRLLLPVLMISLFILAACGAQPQTPSNAAAPDASEPQTRLYQADNGQVEIPAEPKRVAILGAAYVGHFLKLGVTPIAVDKWAKGNSFFGDQLAQTEVVDVDSIEKLLALEPDLIVAYDTNKNLQKYAEIAPTVALKYDKYHYLDLHVEIGKMLGKEEEAKAWVEDWKQRTGQEQKKVKAAIGEEATVMVMETFGKEMYVYGNNWGRGTEVIYQALGIKAPEKLVQDVFGTGYKAISTEVIPQYAADYIFVGDGKTTENTFMETDVWKNLPAVKNNRVIPFDPASFMFNDPISLEKELEIILAELTKQR